MSVTDIPRYKTAPSDEIEPVDGSDAACSQLVPDYVQLSFDLESVEAEEDQESCPQLS